MARIRIGVALWLGACAQGELTFEGGAEPLRLVPDIDDDDEDGRPDWRRGRADDDEVATVVVPARVFRGAPKATRFALRVLGEGDARLFHDGEAVADLESGWWTAPWTAGEELVLGVAVQDPGGTYVVELQRTLPSGRTDTATLPVQAAPMILGHHLAPVEQVWLMEVSEGWDYNNDAMVAAYAEHLGEAATFVDGWTYQYDVWVQDEMQLGSLTDPSRRHAFVLDSMRDRELDPLPKSLEGPDRPRQTYGRGFATTYDSFGNLEVSPPVVVDGVAYPFGRIYYGDRGRRGIDDELEAFLSAQRVQAPFPLDTSWLCVGHVDEFVSTLPAPDTEKGFVVAYADVDLGLELLRGLDPALRLPRYARVDPFLGHARPTVGSLVDDPALVALNERVRDEHLLPLKAELAARLGLSDEDFVPVPMLFEEAFDCAGEVVALTPGMVNLVVAERDGAAHVFLADPFVRDADDASGQDRDPFIAWMRGALPPHLELHFVDDWYVYHMAMGEVHCATNELRTPSDAPWWEVAAHLLEVSE